MEIAREGGSGGAYTGAVSAALGKDGTRNEAGGVGEPYRGYSKDRRDGRCRRLGDT